MGRFLKYIRVQTQQYPSALDTPFQRELPTNPQPQQGRLPVAQMMPKSFDFSFTIYGNGSTSGSGGSTP